MDIQEVLKKQKGRKLKVLNSPIKTPSIEEYTSNPNAPRPYDNAIAVASRNSNSPTNINDQQYFVDHLEKGHCAKKDKSNNPDTDSTQTRHKPDTDPAQMGHRLDTKPDTKLDTKSQQKHNLKMLRNSKIIPIANVKTTIACLSGNELTLLKFFVDDCKEARSEITQPYTRKAIANLTGLKQGSVRNTIHRLIQKALLINNYSKRGGCAAVHTYSIPTSIYQEVLNTTLSFKLDTTLDTKPDTNAPSSNSNINTITILDNEWLNLDYTGATGISRREVLNLRRKNPTITAKEVQQSIYAFAWTLKHNPTQFKPTDNPVAIFVSQLQGGALWEEEGYKTPEEQQQELERKSRLDNLNQQKESQFDEYFHNLGSEERNKLVSFYPEAKNETGYDNETLRREVIDRKYIKRHYDNNIWPKLVEKELEELI